MWRKRIFDMVLSSLLLVLLALPFIGLLLLLLLVQKGNVFFLQERVGQYGKCFTIFKLRTLTTNKQLTRFGKYLRSMKIDELPQLLNILKGDMSLVGPRPDVPEVIDTLQEQDQKVILSMKPGLTSPASIKYVAEEVLLAHQENAATYEQEVIWPDKIRLNKAYVEAWSFQKDIQILIQTLAVLLQKK